MKQEVKEKLYEKKPIKILAFNITRQVLVSIHYSTIAAAKAHKVSVQAISQAASGKGVSSANMYFRQVPENIEISVEDLGTLTLKEYDSLIGIETKEVRKKPHVGRRAKINQENIESYGN